MILPNIYKNERAMRRRKRPLDFIAAGVNTASISFSPKYLSEIGEGDHVDLYQPSASVFYTDAIVVGPVARCDDYVEFSIINKDAKSSSSKVSVNIYDHGDNTGDLVYVIEGYIGSFSIIDILEN